MWLVVKQIWTTFVLFIRTCGLHFRRRHVIEDQNAKVRHKTTLACLLAFGRAVLLIVSVDDDASGAWSYPALKSTLLGRKKFNLENKDLASRDKVLL